MQIIAAVQRKLLYGLAADHLALCVAGRLDQQRLAGDYHRLGCGADFKLEVESEYIRDAEDDAGADYGFKSCPFNSNFVCARVQQGCLRESGRIGLQLPYQSPGFGTSDRDTRVPDSCIGSIGYSDVDVTCGALCPQQRSGKQPHCKTPRTLVANPEHTFSSVVS